MVRNSLLIKGFGKIVAVGPPLALRMGERSERKSTNRRLKVDCEKGEAEMKARDTFQRLGWGAQGRQRRHPLIAGILVLVLLAQVGCASSGVDKRSASSLYFPAPRPASQELGKVGVTSGRFAPTFAIDDVRPLVKDRPHRMAVQKEGSVGGALKGALEGFFAPLQLGAAGHPLVLPIIAVLMPVGLVVGLLDGAGLLPVGNDEEHEEPRDELREQREAAARGLVASQMLQDNRRDRVAAISQLKTPHTFTVLADQGPTTVDERPGYRLLSQEGIQTVLEVVVESVALNCDGQWSTPSPLRMEVIVRIRLVRTVDDERIYLNWVTYKGEKAQTLEKWISDPENLRHELNSAIDDIAKKTVEEIFFRTESN